MLYAEVFREVESGIRRDGLWAKSLSESDFDEAKAKSLYIKYRFQAIKDELMLTQDDRRQEDEKIKQEELRQQSIRDNYEKKKEKSLSENLYDVPLVKTKKDKPLTCNSCEYQGEMIWTSKVSLLGWLLIFLFGGLPLFLVTNFLPDSMWFNGIIPLVAILFGFYFMYLLVSKYEVKCPKCKNRGGIFK